MFRERYSPRGFHWDSGKGEFKKNSMEGRIPVSFEKRLEIQRKTSLFSNESRLKRFIFWQNCHEEGFLGNFH